MQIACQWITAFSFFLFIAHFFLYHRSYLINADDNEHLQETDAAQAERSRKHDLHLTQNTNFTEPEIGISANEIQLEHVVLELEGKK